MNCPVHDVPMKWETMTEEWSVSIVQSVVKINMPI